MLVVAFNNSVKTPCGTLLHYVSGTVHCQHKSFSALKSLAALRMHAPLRPMNKHDLRCYPGGTDKRRSAVGSTTRIAVASSAALCHEGVRKPSTIASVLLLQTSIYTT